LIRVRRSRYDARHMRIDVTSSETRGFEAIADAIMYRWTTERDTWVSTTEVAQARAYLERLGVAAASGEPPVGGDIDSLAASRLVLLGLRHLHAARRRG